MIKEVFAAALVVLVVVSKATAGFGNAWFTLVSTNGNASATEGPGLALEIVNAAPGEVLTIGYNFTASFGPMHSWDINLTTTSGIFQNGDWSSSNAAGYNLDFGNPIQQNFNFDAGGISSSGNGVGGLVFAFELVVDVAGDITGNFGPLGQIVAAGHPWYGYVGSNSETVGISGTSFGSLPVISVVPEPFTISLLAFGSFIILRRRRVGDTKR